MASIISEVLVITRGYLLPYCGSWLTVKNIPIIDAVHGFAEIIHLLAVSMVIRSGLKTWDNFDDFCT